MSGLNLKLKIDDRIATRFLEKLQNFNSSEMFDEMGSYGVEEVGRRFKAGEDWQGNDLIPSQRAIAEDGKTLVDHGHLRDSYTHQLHLDGVEIGSNMVYAAIHHFGGETGRNKATTLAARPVLGFNADDEDELEHIAFDHLQELFK